MNKKESEEFLKQVEEDLKTPLSLTPTPKIKETEAIIKERKRFTDQVDKYKGTLVLFSGGKVKILEGFGEDDIDYYYIVADLHGQVVWESCVSRFIPLIERLKPEEHKHILEIFALNDWRKLEIAK